MSPATLTLAGLGKVTRLLPSGTEGLGADAVVAATVVIPDPDTDSAWNFFITEIDPVEPLVFRGVATTVGDVRKPPAPATLDVGDPEVMTALTSDRGEIRPEGRTLREIALQEYSPLDLADLEGAEDPPGLRRELAGEYWVVDTSETPADFVAEYTTLAAADEAMLRLGKQSRFYKDGSVHLAVDEKKPDEIDRLEELKEHFDPKTFREARQQQPRFGTRRPFTDLYYTSLHSPKVEPQLAEREVTL